MFGVLKAMTDHLFDVESTLHIDTGTVVEVETRAGPGWKGGNGGAGKVKNVNEGPDGVTYDVKYFMNGSEKGVLPIHIHEPGQLEKRESEAPENFEPEVNLFSA